MTRVEQAWGGKAWLKKGTHRIALRSPISMPFYGAFYCHTSVHLHARYEMDAETHDPGTNAMPPVALASGTRSAVR